jgi:ferrochelatase
MNFEDRIGVLLVNSGTIEELSERGIRTFLKRMLGDRRVVNLPRIIWLPILYFSILRKRPKETLWRYKLVWEEGGSYYDRISSEQRKGVEEALHKIGHTNTTVLFANRYSKPQIKEAFKHFKSQGINKIVVLPLFPQSAYSTTASIYDEVTRCTQRTHKGAELTFIKDYHKNPYYIEAIAERIEESLGEARDLADAKLIFSFHSIPTKDIEAGDTYELQTSTTATLLAERLKLNRSDWTIAYQSRFNDTRKWISPFLPDTLSTLACGNRNNVFVVCPGFATDCIETLVEVGITAKEDFMNEAYEEGVLSSPEFTYIKALDSREKHLMALARIIARKL